MAERVEGDFQFRTTSAKYPWEQWLDGAIWKLTPGKDFTSSVRAVDQAARGWAKNHGLRVHLSQRDGFVYIKAEKAS